MLQTITLSSDLPTITEQVNLDGYQPKAGPPATRAAGTNASPIQLNLQQATWRRPGPSTPPASVGGTSSAGSTIIGLYDLRLSGGAGIHIQSNNVIGHR